MKGGCRKCRFAVFVSDVIDVICFVDVSTCQGHWAAAEIEARLRMKDFMEKEASNATQDANGNGSGNLFS